MFLPSILNARTTHQLNVSNISNTRTAHYPNGSSFSNAPYSTTITQKPCTAYNMCAMQTDADIEWVIVWCIVGANPFHEPMVTT